MTDKEIIKCLRHCRAGDCEECKALGVCNATFSFHKNALDLMNRQNAEIEQWKEEANRWQNAWCKAVNDIEKTKSEAIKEFAERLKENYYFTDRWGKIITKSTVDDLVKEMTEEK